MVEIGLSLGTSQKEPISRSIDLIREAEEQGVDSVWILDSQMTMKDPYVVQSLAADQTSDIKLGPGVTNLITRDRTVTANAISDIWEVSDGRARLGLGTGDSAVKPLGKSPSSLREFRRGIEQIRGLLRGEEVEYNGETLQFKESQASVPIYVAASGPTSLKLAGEFGDGVIMMTPADKGMIEWGLSRVQKGIENRDSSLEPEPDIDLWVTISVDEDEEKAIQDVKPQAVAQARWLHDRENLPDSLEQYRDEMREAAEAYDYNEHLSLEAEHADLVSDEFARSIAVAGDEDHCVERLRNLSSLRLDSITLSLLSKGREKRLRNLGESVLPRLD